MRWLGIRRVGEGMRGGQGDLKGQKIAGRKTGRAASLRGIQVTFTGRVPASPAD